MGWTEVWQYSKLVKCPLENQYFASYITIAAVYFERICTSGNFRQACYDLKSSCFYPFSSESAFGNMAEIESFSYFSLRNKL